MYLILIIFYFYYSGLKPEDIELTMGATARSEDAVFVQTRKAFKIILHPKFIMPLNDIALIRVSK